MNEFTLLIEEWEADIQRLQRHLRRLASPVSAPQALAERHRIERELHHARQAQALLHDLSQVHTGAFGLAA